MSYRRSDTPEVARHLAQRLGREFGAANVFFDIADIQYGQRWRDEVTRQIRAADIVIALIGPKWLETLDARAQGDDVLRFELATALEHEKAPVSCERAILLGYCKTPSTTLAVIIA